MKQHTTFCKRVLSLILVFMLTVSLLPSASLSVSAAENYMEFLGGDGSEKSPYLIANKTHFNNIRKYATANAHFKLVQDIVFSENCDWDLIDKFNGVLDGDNHLIKSFCDSDNYSMGSAIFKEMSGTVKNLKISGMVSASAILCQNNRGYINNCIVDGFLYGNDYIKSGAFTENNYGTIANCINNADLSVYEGGISGIAGTNYGYIRYCENYGSASPFWCGYGNAGIASINNGIIIGCANKAKEIACQYGSAGGIVAANNKYIYRCYNEGFVKGGYDGNYGHAAFVGTNSSTGYITDCYNTADIYSSYGDRNKGIFFAFNKGVISNCYSAVNSYETNIFGYQNTGLVENCYYLYPWNDFNRKGITVGNDTTVGCTANQMKSKDTFKGFDFNKIWKFDNDSKYSYPVFTGIDITDVQIISIPNKTYTATIGTRPDISDINLKVKYSDGTERIINADSLMCTTLDVNKLGTQTINLTYQGITTSGSVTVNIIDKEISGIEVYKNPTKTNYVQGQSIDLTGGTITICYNNGTKETIAMTNANATYDKTITGSVPVTLSYQGFTTIMNITVNEKTVDYMLFTEPKKLVYYQGESLELSGASLDVHYVSDDNYSEKVAVSFKMISGYNPNVIGIQTVFITYLNKSVSFTVRVIERSTDTIKSISVKSMPDKLVYVEGEPLDLTGGLLNVKYSDGVTATVNMSEAKPYYNPTLLGNVTVRLEYKGLNTFFQIVVNEKQITSIVVEKEPDKLEYVQGQPLNLSGGVIKLYYNNNTTDIVDMKEATIYYDRTLTGDVSVQLNYKNSNTYLQIKVHNKAVKNINLSLPEKTEYKVGEQIDISGLSLDVIYKSKDNYGEKITVTPEMITGYDPQKVGVQIITVTYLNVKVLFEVEVVPIIGDVDCNGVIDIKDVTMLQRYLAEINTLTTYSIAVADANNDGNININDVTAIQTMLVNG